VDKPQWHPAMSMNAEMASGVERFSAFDHRDPTHRCAMDGHPRAGTGGRSHQWHQSVRKTAHPALSPGGGEGVRGTADEAVGCCRCQFQAVSTMRRMSV